jgi:ATP-binding cassette subfamily C protein
MLQALKASLSFMSPAERRRLGLLISLRAVLALLDLAGILAIGFLATSAVASIVKGNSAQTSSVFSGFPIPTISNENLPFLAASILGLFLTKALFSIILTKKAAFFVARIEAKASKTIAEIGFGGDLGDARKRSREEMMFAIQAGSPAAFNVLLNSTNTLITETTLFLVILIGFFFVDPFATFAAVLYFGIVLGVMQYFIGSLMSKSGEISARQAVVASTAISDLLAVFRELLVQGKRKKYINDIYEAKVASADSSATQYYLSGMPRYIIETALLLGIVLFVVSQALSGDLAKSAGTIGIFLSGGFRLTAALLPLQNSMLTIKSILPAANTAHEILALQEPIFEDPNLSKGEPIYEGTRALGVEFKSVSFTYPVATEAAVTDLNFVFKPGSQVALMGPSGAGKSTIADLICGVIKPTAGSVVISNLERLGENQYSKGAISYVPQKPGLVSGTIVDNVALGIAPPQVNRERVLESLKLSHLGGLVESLPEGIDTPLGKLQDGLSGGQIQRLGLARALYAKPGLLVMDEATSALDGESEMEIQRALAEMRTKVTVVLIAHRLNTIQHADAVILVESGKVTDIGTFKEIQTRNPQVERLVKLMQVKPS